MQNLSGFRVSYQALYSYTPQNDDELELRDGDIVDVMEKCDDGWFVGECDTCLSFFSLLNFLVSLFILIFLPHTDGRATEGTKENWLSVAFPNLREPWQVTESGK